MCLICASQPTPPDSTTAATLHAAPPDQQITPVYVSGAMGFGTDLPAADIAALAWQLTDGYWQSTGRSARSFDVAPGGTLTVDLSGLTAAGATLARQALDAWTEVTGIVFDDNPATGAPIQITFDDSQSGAYSSSDVWGSTIFASSVNVSTDWIATYGTGPDSYSLQTYIHEIGHALGLGHAGNYNGSANLSDMVNAYDSWQATVMSYFSQTQNSTVNASYAYTLGVMAADLAAIQALYGTWTVEAGDTTYGVGATAGGVHPEVAAVIADGVLGRPVAFTIADGGGIDTLDLSTDTLGQSITLIPGTVSSAYGLTGNIVITADTLIERVIAGAGSDRVLGNDAPNFMDLGAGGDNADGGRGRDTILGGAGADTLLGGYGNDQLSGGSENDWLDGDRGTDRIWGGTGDDTIHGGDDNDLLLGEDGDDQIHGGAGTDRIWGDDGNDAIWGDAGIDLIRAGRGDDTIEGGAGADRIWGDAGADTIFGGADADTLRGGAQADGIDGGTEDDVIYGDAGNDVLIGGDGNDALIGGTGRDWIGGDAGDDLLIGQDDADTLSGGTGADTLDGGTGDDLLSGGNGDDILRGREDADMLRGGAGDDLLNGGDGADTLDGGAGFDIYLGEAGCDVFVFAAVGDSGGARIDEIRDFTAGEDLIDLSAIAATTGGLTFIGTADFAQAGDLRYGETTLGLLVEIDLDGDCSADFQCALRGVASLTEADFLL